MYRHEGANGRDHRKSGKAVREKAIVWEGSWTNPARSASSRLFVEANSVQLNLIVPLSGAALERTPRRLEIRSGRWHYAMSPVPLTGRNQGHSLLTMTVRPPPAMEIMVTASPVVCINQFHLKFPYQPEA